MSRLKQLLKEAAERTLSDEEREAQRRSFAYGNVSLSNPAVTRELVDEVADRMKAADPTEEHGGTT